MSGGTFLRGEDGSLYFIRDEILDACKVEGEHLERSEAILGTDADGEVEGFAFSWGATPVSTVKYVQSPNIVATPNFDAGKLDPSKFASTVMCPW
jgi:hypothetical protein